MLFPFLVAPLQTCIKLTVSCDAFLKLPLPSSGPRPLDTLDSAISHSSSLCIRIPCHTQTIRPNPQPHQGSTSHGGGPLGPHKTSPHFPFQKAGGSAQSLIGHNSNPRPSHRPGRLKTSTLRCGRGSTGSHCLDLNFLQSYKVHCMDEYTSFHLVARAFSFRRVGSAMQEKRTGRILRSQHAPCAPNRTRTEHVSQRKSGRAQTRSYPPQEIRR